MIDRRLLIVLNLVLACLFCSLSCLNFAKHQMLAAYLNTLSVITNVGAAYFLITRH